MFKFHSVRLPGSIAAVVLLLSLMACNTGLSVRRHRVSGPTISSQPVGPLIKSGQDATLSVGAEGRGDLSYQWFQGPTGTTTTPIAGATADSYQTPNLTTTTSYWVQVTDSTGNTNSNTAVVLISGPRAVQALLFPVLTSGNPIFGSFMAKVLPNITGVSVSLPWSEIESSDPTGTKSGGYNFSSYDANLQPYLAAGRKVNLIVWPATEGGSNSSTPEYIFSAAYASSLPGNPAPQDVVYCGTYPGTGALVERSANIDTPGFDNTGLPVSYELPFMTGYQNFIKAVIQHYNAPGAPHIGYIRFGMSQGGESSPECNQYWPNYSETVYVNYVTAMTQTVTAENPTMTILEDLHAVGSPNSPDYTYTTQESALAVANREGFGTNGWQQSDIQNFHSNQPCDSDWCNLFDQYAGTKYGSTPVTLSLQTLEWSDPTGVSETGSLVDLIPFAQSNAANNLELYLADLGLAYDLVNYCNYPHAACPVANTTAFSSAYAEAINGYLAPQ
jgi:hypothetical protein